MRDKQAAAQSRERLIEAALVVIQEHGAPQLTLDLVAAQAQMSKGGLLHHFRSKEALIEAVLRHLLDVFNTSARKYYDTDPEPHGRWARAYAHASFDSYDIPFHALAPLFIHVDQSESLRTVVQQDVQEWEDRLFDDGLPPERATIVRLVCDAYLAERIVHTAPRLPAEALLEEILKLTR
jgi:AcrR family transcriptional regulator